MNGRIHESSQSSRPVKPQKSGVKIVNREQFVHGMRCFCRVKVISCVVSAVNILYSSKLFFHHYLTILFTSLDSSYAGVESHGSPRDSRCHRKVDSANSTFNEGVHTGTSGERAALCFVRRTFEKLPNTGRTAPQERYPLLGTTCSLYRYETRLWAYAGFRAEDVSYLQ